MWGSAYSFTTERQQRQSSPPTSRRWKPHRSARDRGMWGSPCSFTTERQQRQNSPPTSRRWKLDCSATDFTGSPPTSRRWKPDCSARDRGRTITESPPTLCRWEHEFASDDECGAMLYTMVNRCPTDTGSVEAGGCCLVFAAGKSEPHRHRVGGGWFFVVWRL